MSFRRHLRQALLALAATLVALCALAPGGASAAQPTLLRTDVQIKKFVVTKTGIGALGTASSQLGTAANRQQVTFAVSKGSTCSILTLSLQQLQLQLLGLNLVTSALNLRITGNTSQTLGALFCRLAGGLKLAKLASARRAVASLNHYMKGHPMHVVRWRAHLATVTAQAAQAAPSCKVLDLVLGPLNLNLLGLVVDLYGPTRTQPVEVHVTADPAAGILGSVFCKLANGQAATA